MGHFIELPKLVHPDFAVPNRKPVGAVEVDDNSPLSRGLLHAYLLDGARVVGGNPGIYSGPIYRDLVNQKSNLIVNNYKPSGDRIIESSSAANYGVVSAANFEHPDKELMVYVVAKTYSTTGSAGRFPFAATMEVGAPYSGFLCGLKDAGLPYFHIGGVFAGNELVGTGDYRDDDWHSYLYHYDGYTMSIWIDGVLNTSKSRTNDVGVNYEFRLGHVQSYGTYHDTEYKSCLIWGKSCPARVVIDAPYSALKPSNPITYFIPSAGGGAYTLSGSSSISLTSSAGFTHNIHPSIAGGANVAVSPTGVLSYNQHHIISGSVTQSITSSATMTYAAGDEISGDVTLTVQPTASLNYNEHHVIAGGSAIAFSSSAAMSYVNAGAYEISGSVTVSATPSAALAYNQHPILSGDTTLYFVSAATMTYATPQEYLLSGASGIDVIPASLMSYVSILAAQYQGRRMTAKDRTRQMIAAHKPRNMR